MTKPIAWGRKDKDGNIYDVICPEEHDIAEGDYTIPLYTHPHPDNLGFALSIIDQQKLEIEALKAHPVKELTDEEIDEVSKKCDEDEQQSKTHEFWYRNFARAILRKAQGK